MDPFLPALAAGGILLGGYVYNRWRFLAWQRMAEQCARKGDLREVKLSSGTLEWKLQGQAGPLKVQITSRMGKGSSQVVIVIPGPPGFSEVSIRREDQAPWKTREIEVGSEAFDKRFFVAGPVRLVYALLDMKTRRLLIKANDAFTFAGSRLEIAGGELLAEAVDDELSLILPSLLSVGRRFAQPREVKQRLARNATEDFEAGVRLQNLLLLVRELPNDPRTLKVLRAACSDKNPQVRLQAGRALGAKGRDVVLKVAESLENDSVSAEAVSSLGRELSFLQTKAILSRALRKHRPHPQTVRACLDALGRDSAVNLLAEVMEQQQGEIAVFAVQALATTGSPNAEGPLIRALQRDQADLRVAAAHALGRAGSVAAVLPLKEAAKRFSRDPELSQATHQAIAEIQSRLQGATPGQLSLAGAEAGRLSLAQAEAGQLSLPTDPAGQLSFSGDDDEPGEA